jgi:magnesium transporter
VRADLAVQTELDELVAMAQLMELDDLVDLLQDLPGKNTRELLRAMDDRRRDSLEQMLSYPEESAGGLMNLDYIQVRTDVTLRTVLRYLRLLDDLPDNTNQLMVVDRSGQYQGTLRLRSLLTNDPSIPVREVMDREPPYVIATQAQAEVARLFEDEDLISAPVLNEKGLLIGRVTVEDVVDVIRDESEHSLMGRVGMHEDEDLFAPVLVSGRRRSVWLGINLITAFLAAWVIGLFEAALDKVVALAVLMPVVASMGGIAGSQTLTLMIRALALGNIERCNAARLLWKEIGVGLINGFVWALVVALISVLWFGDYGIGGVIAVAMVVNLLCAALAGVVIPLILRRVGVDPALAGGVVLTTVTDVVGFLAFLGLATLLLI